MILEMNQGHTLVAERGHVRSPEALELEFVCDLPTTVSVLRSYVRLEFLFALMFHLLVTFRAVIFHVFEKTWTKCHGSQLGKMMVRKMDDI